MEAFWGTTREPAFLYWVGWLSAVGCFAYTCEAARRVSKRPTLFMALALLAGAWVLAAAAVGVRLDAIKIIAQKKIVTNSEISIADRAFDMASFLFVFVGASLAREAPREHPLQWLQAWVQVSGLGVLFYLVLPDRIPVKPPQLTHAQMSLLTGEILSIVGFAALGFGAYAISKNRLMMAAAIVTLIAYECLSAYRMWELWDVRPEEIRPPIAWQLAYLFILARCCLTLIVCHLVVTHYRSVRLQEELEKAGTKQPA
jgi:hypothetical protein